MMIVVIRNGEVRLRIPATVSPDGTVREVTSGYPVWDGHRVEADGIDKNALMARTKARKLTATDLAYTAHMGDNGNGLVLMDALGYDRLEWERKAPEREAKARRMAELFPGLDALRAAHEDELRYRDQINRMMDDEDNDGVRPPKPVAVHYSDIVGKYPAAAAYLRAEAYAHASHYAKAGAGNRAIKRLESREPYQQVLADMEAEWSKAASDAVDNS